METFKSVVLILHITAGGLALGSGIAAMFFKKGSRAHVVSGRIFFWAMFAVFCSAIVLSVLNQQAFLFFIAIFSFYLSIGGKLSLSYFRGAPIASSHIQLHRLAILLHILMLAFGLYALLIIESTGLFILSSVFGGIGLMFSLQNLSDVRKRNATKKMWLARHISGMMGAFISTISAFSVVTMDILPPLLRWLWPTLVFTPFIVYWQRKISGKRQQEKVKQY